MYNYVVTLFVILNAFFDFNYFIKTLYGVWSGRICKGKCTLNEVTTVYGICSFRDCNITFNSIRLARLIRQLDFARYNFYDRTGIYQRSKELKVTSLQGCTLTVTYEPVPLFWRYKIETELVYWDDRSLFLEHKVITLCDARVRSFIVSRQHVIGENAQSASSLLEGLPGSEVRPVCREYLKDWFKSMEISSAKLRSVK
ncbi:protein THEM6 isoform X1 [Bombyx mori]|uniref:Protein THEM6 n=1 Tax=Bombyx mori TaxID=7091 RepID=A0A8R2GAC9_BOMMO|nr:protein THEM6-like [Bombyx mori]